MFVHASCIYINANVSLYSVSLWTQDIQQQYLFRKAKINFKQTILFDDPAFPEIYVCNLFLFREKKYIETCCSYIITFYWSIPVSERCIAAGKEKMYNATKYIDWLK